MAKWRALHATITTDGKVNRLSEFGQLLYDRIVVKADDWGIITGDTFELKGETIPLSSRTFEEMSDALQEMTDQSLIWQYEPEGVGPLVQIRKFDDHQPGALISKRTTPKLPLHPEWRPIAGDDRSVGLLEEVASLIPGIADLLQELTGNGCLDKTRVDKNRQDKSPSPNGEPKRKTPNTPHQRTVAGYIERIAKGYSKRFPGPFVGDTKAIKHMLERGHSEETILACYDSFKGEHYWAGRHLPMIAIDKNIDDWKKAGGTSGKDRRRDQGPTGTDDKQYLRDALREKS